MPRGFGLLSVLISLLIVGLLTVVALRQYFQASLEPLTGSLPAEGVRPDQGARISEAQVLLSRMLAALTLCAQTKGAAARIMGGDGACSLVEVAANAGVGADGATADGRWRITVAQIGLQGTPPVPVGQVSVAGTGGNATGLSASLFATAGGTVTRCDASGGPPPASPSSGQGC